MYAIRSYYASDGYYLVGENGHIRVGSATATGVISLAADHLEDPPERGVRVFGLEGGLARIREERVGLEKAECALAHVITSYSIHYTKLYETKGVMEKRQRRNKMKWTN